MAGFFILRLDKAQAGCEDRAIAKYARLLAAVAAPDRLRLICACAQLLL